MIQIPMASTELCGANILFVSAGTEGPSFGDSGDTFFHLKDKGGTAMYVAVNSGEFQQVFSVTLKFCGDSECETFLEAMIFSACQIRSQWRANQLKY